MVITKKRTKSFIRHQSDRFKRVGESWRKPRGIDGPVRRRFRGARRMASIGFRNDRNTRYCLPNGRYKYTIQNAQALDSLIMHKEKLAIEIGSSVSTKSRVAILETALKQGFFVTNRRAKVEQAANV